MDLRVKERQRERADKDIYREREGKNEKERGIESEEDT